MAREKRNPLPQIEYLTRVDDERRAQLDTFAEKVGVKIKDYDLINRALSHKSFTNEKGYSHNEQYEKLEFFGDGVLGLIVNEYLFKVFPESEEGELAKIKSAVVSEVMLAEVAREIGLGEMILIGRGEKRSGGSERPSLLADILEAFIGAVYMDQGLPASRRFVIRYLESSIRNMSTDKSVGDYKSYLQETIQRERGVRPVYSVMRSSGPDHSRIFRVAVSIDGRKWGTGSGKSKKEAEQDAAENALNEWEKAGDDEKNQGSRRGSRRRPHADRGGAASRDRHAANEAGEIAPGEESVDGVEPAEGDASTQSGAADQAREGRGRRGRRGRRGGRGGRERQEKSEHKAKPPRSAAKQQQPRERAATRHKGFRRGRPEEEMLPPKEVVDPIAWAAGESYVPRSRSVNP
ncbi:MAG: ribonuclease III [Candidatus Hydrogenedentota bacterium]